MPGLLGWRRQQQKLLGRDGLKEISKDLASMTWDLILTMERIWIGNNKGVGPLDSNRLPRQHSVAIKGVNCHSGTWHIIGSL